jgi:hypothetical protein
MTGFTKFDPRAFLENERRKDAPLKPLTLASGSGFSGEVPPKLKTQNDLTLATLASLIINNRAVIEPKSSKTQVCTYTPANVANTAKVRREFIEAEASLPPVWREGVASLCAAANPPSILSSRWRELVGNAARFLDRWGASAAALGWTVEDLFGCHAEAPLARVDLQGLVLLVGTGEVVAITDATATIKTGSGSLLIFRRTPLPPGERPVPIWNLCGPAL